jgi:tetratricopeptide (TPR) repeat protein
MEQIINKIGYPKLLRTCYHLGGTIACARKSWDEAVNDLEKAVNTLPHQYGENDQHAVYIEALASSLYQRGDLDPARAQYEKIISLTTGRLSAGDAYARSLYRLGIICQEKKEPEQAREYFQRFLDVLRNADAGLPDVEDARKRLDSSF